MSESLRTRVRAAATCDHAWEKTEITHAVSGRKWQHIAECFYCAKCRNFSRRTRWFLDGQFYPTDRKADAANADANAVYVAEKAAWLREHYPAHVEQESER